MKLIDLEELQKFPIRADHYDKKNGNKNFVLGIESLMEYAENLPIAYDVDKVIEQLKEEGCIIDDEAGSRAIEIILKGGVE